MQSKIELSLFCKKKSFVHGVESIIVKYDVHEVSQVLGINSKST